MDSTVTMTDTPTPQASESAPPAEAPAKANATRTKHMRLMALGGALFGIVFGGIIQYFVSGAMDATGWFGQTLERVVEDQNANFADLRSKLEALNKAAPGSPEAASLQKEIAALIAAQEKLTGRTHAEMALLQEEVSTLRAQALKEQGSAGGADFWLLTNESVTLREAGHVFSLLGVHSRGSSVDVNLSGAVKRLKPGDFIEFETSDSTCKVYYKAGRAREDGRYGFDLVCALK